jgi:5-methylcytosine-specific restriction endonuclease McrA
MPGRKYGRYGARAGSPKYRQVWERDEGICRYCEYPADAVDHVEPHSLNRNNALDNLVLACARCNTIAGGQYLGDFVTKRDYILNVRRPEMIKDAQRWAREE